VSRGTCFINRNELHVGRSMISMILRCWNSRWPSLTMVPRNSSNHHSSTCKTIKGKSYACACRSVLNKTERIQLKIKLIQHRHRLKELTFIAKITSSTPYTDTPSFLRAPPLPPKNFSYSTKYLCYQSY